ncbi:MAG TPA: hypothetical protein VNT79_18865 [Phycisphaerae bacterium]|nr:hypothetical protein [Phycisphaerae bacterium]
MQLNRREEARAALATLRDLMKDPACTDDADAIALTAEAEALIEGQPTTSQASEPPTEVGDEVCGAQEGEPLL